MDGGGELVGVVGSDVGDIGGSDVDGAVEEAGVEVVVVLFVFAIVNAAAPEGLCYDN